MASSTTIELAKVSKMTLRQRMRAKIDVAMKPSERQVQAYVVFHQVLNHQKYNEARQISVYVSTANEVDTIAILADAFSKRKRCFIPYVGINSNNTAPQPEMAPRTRMIMVELKSMSEYAQMPLNRWGIKEPNADFLVNRQIADPTLANLDLAIVPGMAFTKNGERLGKGKGYYDEFLFDWANRSPKPLYTIGLALNCQMVDDVFAVEGKDFVLDEVISAQ